MNNNNITSSQKVLIEYLHSFLPATLTEENTILKSSQDIQDDLTDMIEIPLSEITETMIDIGYKIKVDFDNRPKWVMSKV